MGESRGLKAGVIGTGSLGNHHARIYASSDKIDEVVLQDSDAVKEVTKCVQFCKEALV